MKILLVVGASGVGKDTLLQSARVHFGRNGKLGFVRRYITRPPDSNEDNYFIDQQGFMVLQEAQFFLSSWQAHHNFYGIARHSLTSANCHRALLCSISRSKVSDFEKRFEHTTTIQITAPEEILARRLLARGRESRHQIEQRLRRARERVTARDLVTFDNSLQLEHSLSGFIALLEKMC